MFGRNDSRDGNTSRSNAPKWMQRDEDRTKLPRHLRDPECEERRR